MLGKLLEAVDHNSEAITAYTKALGLLRILRDHTPDDIVMEELIAIVGRMSDVLVRTNSIAEIEPTLRKILGNELFAAIPAHTVAGRSSST
jgi:hypothetical protein